MEAVRRFLDAAAKLTPVQIAEVLSLTDTPGQAAALAPMGRLARMLYKRRPVIKAKQGSRHLSAALRAIGGQAALVVALRDRVSPEAFELAVLPFAPHAKEGVSCDTSA
ncbi:MAG: hypothetical protein ACYC9D_07835 [Candidatus Dormibacteria bacterium]